MSTSSDTLHTERIHAKKPDAHGTGTFCLPMHRVSARATLQPTTNVTRGGRPTGAEEARAEAHQLCRAAKKRGRRSRMKEKISPTATPTAPTAAKVTSSD